MHNLEEFVREWLARLESIARSRMARLFPPDPEVFVASGEEAGRVEGPVIACLDSGRCFISKTDHPLEAWRHIRDILALEAADLPFDASAHVSDWKAERTAGCIRAVQAFARKSEVAALAAELRARGYAVGAMDVRMPDGTMLGLDLLAGVEPVQPQLRLPVALAAASFLFLVSFGWHAYGVLDQKTKYLEGLQAAARSNSAAVAEIIANGAKLRDAEVQLQSLAVVLAKPAFPELWEELARHMPDDSQALRLEFKDSQLVLEGLSPDATRLAAELSGGAGLGQTAQTAPILRDGSGKERFSLTMALGQVIP